MCCGWERLLIGSRFQLWHVWHGWSVQSLPSPFMSQFCPRLDLWVSQPISVLWLGRALDWLKGYYLACAPRCVGSVPPLAYIVPLGSRPDLWVSHNCGTAGQGLYWACVRHSRHACWCTRLWISISNSFASRLVIRLPLVVLRLPILTWCLPSSLDVSSASFID